MKISKSTIAAALILSVSVPVTASAGGEGPFEIGGKNVFERNRDSQRATSQTLDTDSGIKFGVPSSGYSGNFLSDHPYEINGKTIFEHNRELRAKRLAEESKQDTKAVTMTPKKRSWFNRYFRPVQSDQS